MQAILKQEVSDVTVDYNPILERELLDDKVGILDIRAKINSNINCNIEMQVVNEHNIEKRILYYWSKMYIRGLKTGQDYNKLEKGIVILFIDFKLEQLSNIDNYSSKWNLREEKYTQNILTDDIEICIIELPKFKETQGKGTSNLDLWLKFIEEPEVVRKMENTNKEIKKASKVLEEISQDEREQYLAELREKYIMDQKAIEDGGFYKGLEQGLKQGENQEKVHIAKKMKDKGISINTIIEITGLTKEEIDRI